MPRIRATHPVSRQLLKVPPREAWAQRMAAVLHQCRDLFRSTSTFHCKPTLLGRQSKTRETRHTSLTPQPARAGLRGRRDVRSTLKTAQLSPSQQAFVDSLQGRLRREQAAEKQLADGTALSTAPCSIGGLSTEGERQAPVNLPALSTALCIGGLSTEGERQAPVKLPNAERGSSAVHAEDRGATAPTSEKRKAQPPEPTRKVLRTETERRDLSTAPSTVERSTEGERQPPE